MSLGKVSSAPIGSPASSEDSRHNQDLPRPARKILKAARRILRKHGFAAMTLQAVADEAGVKKPAIGYYFGNKAGLVCALADSVTRLALGRYAKQMPVLDDDDAKVRAYLEVCRQSAIDEGRGLESIEILPTAVRNREMRAIIRRLYDQYRELNLENLSLGLDVAAVARFTSLAGLATAVLDGMAIQVALGVDESLVSAAWEEWARIVTSARNEASLASDIAAPGEHGLNHLPSPSKHTGA